MSQYLHYSNRILEDQFGIVVAKKKRGVDHRNPANISHYAIVDRHSGEVIDDDCTSICRIAQYLGYTKKSSTTSYVTSFVRKLISEGGGECCVHGIPRAINIIKLA